jgi:hypothetical protein
MADQSQARRPAPPSPDCKTCEGTGENVYGQRCVCTYNKARAALSRTGEA